MSERKQDEAGTLRQLGVHEFSGNSAGFLPQARAGRSFLITSRDVVLAELHPPSAPVRSRRQPSKGRGKIRMVPDFDVLPPPMPAAIEGEAG